MSPSRRAPAELIQVGGRELALWCPLAPAQAAAVRAFARELRQRYAPSEMTTAAIAAGALGRQIFALLASPVCGPWSIEWAASLRADLDQAGVPDYTLAAFLATRPALIDELARILEAPPELPAILKAPG